MKKMVLVFVMIAAAATMHAQSQLKTVRGKTRDGKTVSVQYYKGTIEDNIESVKYQVVDELEARVKTLQSEKNELQSKLNTANKQIQQLRKQVDANDKQDGYSQALQDSLDRKIGEINDLNERIDRLNVQVQQLDTEKADLQIRLESVSNEVEQYRNGYVHREKTPVIGLEVHAGPTLFGKTVNDQWQSEMQLSKQASIYYGTSRLTPSFPLSFEAGVKINQVAMKAYLKGYEKTVEDLVDVDGDGYIGQYSFSDLSERLSLTYLGIPVRVCFGQPTRNVVSVYAKLGVTPSFLIGNQFEGDGTYSLTGRYEQYDLTLSDIEELGFVNDAPCYTDESKPETNTFVLWGNVALGACVPFGKSPIQLNFGIKADCSLTSIGKAGKAEVLTEGAGLLQNEGRIVIPSVTIGIVYTIK